MKNLFTAFFTLLSITLFAQVPRTVVIEHFTNTRCGICANRNPDLFTNLNNNPEVLHLAVHPSSPYSSCVFNQEDVAGNDGRTNYYNIYGATPRIVVQGSVIPSSTSFGDATLFSSQAGQTSPFNVRVNIDNINAMQATVSVVVKTEAVHNFIDLKLFTALAEDTVYYNAPNGEGTHYNVFRTSVFEVDGKTITPATMVGDSVMFTETVTLGSNWDWNRLVGISILQESGNKSVLQAATSKNQLFTSTQSIETAPFQLYSAENKVFFNANKAGRFEVQVYNLQGQLLKQLQSNNQDEWVFDDIVTGAYLIRIQQDGKGWTKILPIIN
jgi:hypothetical protein